MVGFKNNFRPEFTLSIAGPEAKEMPLTAWGPQPGSGVTSLFTQGPEANSVTLFIGEEVKANGSIPLYLQSPMSDEGGTLVQGEISLSASGTSAQGIPSGVALYVAAPAIGSGTVVIPLNVATDPLPTGYVPGTLPMSGFLTVSVSGANPGGVGIDHEAQTTLFIHTAYNATSGIPLHMERNFANIVPLSVPVPRDTGSGIMTIAISGAYMYDSSTTLFTKSPTNKTLVTFIKGYRE